MENIKLANKTRKTIKIFHNRLPPNCQIAKRIFVGIPRVKLSSEAMTARLEKQKI